MYVWLCACVCLDGGGGAVYASVMFSCFLETGLVERV